MIRELGYCSGILELTSRFFDRTQPAHAVCLLDYFPDDYLMFVNESHVTMPQISGMSGGDRSRKLTLVEYGFRLPSAIDNRPLNFQEFERMVNQVVYVTATPANYELQQAEGIVVEQVVRPTGLLDPPIDVRPSINQVDDLVGEIHKRIVAKEQALVTTLTKRMAEELDKYFTRLLIKCRYIHSDIDTMERVEIIQSLRLGEIDVLIRVNLICTRLRPTRGVVGGYFRTCRQRRFFAAMCTRLTQTSGRAARNSNGLVIMYADKMTVVDAANHRRNQPPPCQTNCL